MMKISFLTMILMSLTSLSAMANEIQCHSVTLSGTQKTQAFQVGFKRYESGRGISEDTSDLLQGDELISAVDHKYIATNQLEWEDFNQVTNTSFKVLKTEIVAKGKYAKSGVKFFDLNATVEIPQDIANKYNDGQQEAVTKCREVISCYGMDC